MATEQRCIVLPVRYELNLYVMQKKVDRPCGLAVRVPAYITEMYCVSREVRTEFICYVEKYTDSVVLRSEFMATERRCIVLPVRYELNLYMLCRRE
jgi:hypothetical protein